MIDDTGIVVAFWILSATTVANALMVVAVRNLIHAVLFLALTFVGVAGLYVVLSADFVAVVQVLIYAGAVTVLLLFALMLTRVGDLPETMVGAQWPLAAAASSLLGGLLIAAVATSDWPGDAQSQITRVPFEALGDALYRQWAVPFEIASLVLLVALVGAIVLAREEEGE